MVRDDLKPFPPLISSSSWFQSLAAFSPSYTTRLMSWTPNSWLTIWSQDSWLTIWSQDSWLTGTKQICTLGHLSANYPVVLLPAGSSVWFYELERIFVCGNPFLITALKNTENSKFAHIEKENNLANSVNFLAEEKETNILKQFECICWIVHFNLACFYI